jgi:hypothetical protein
LIPFFVPNFVAEMHTIDLRKRLAELDAQIAEQKCVLHELERARTVAERELYTTAKFPVLTLPAEITAEIFGHCLPPSSNMGWYRSIDSYINTAPIVLTGVCRTWRDIALTTPKLWATLDIPFDILPPQLASKPASEDFIDRWLARAGQVPLSFVFRAMLGQHDVEQPRMRDLIHRYSNRLRYLELYTTEPQIRFLELDSVEFPLLESAALNWDVPGESPPLVHVFSHAPGFTNWFGIPDPEVRDAASPEFPF